MKMRRLVSIICILAMLNASILSAYGAVEANHQCNDEEGVLYAQTAMEYFDPDDKSDLAEPISFFAYRDLYQGSYGSELSDAQKEYYDLLVETYLDAETKMPNGNSAELSFAPSEKIELTIDPETGDPTEEGQLVINALYEDIVYGYYAFVHDYPEVFWAGGLRYGCGYSYYSTGNGWITTIRIIPQERYTGAAAQSEAFASGVDEAVAEVKEMRTSDNVYYTIKAAHDYLCEKVTYNYDAVKDPDNHTYAHSCGPVFTETAPSVVCEGYGKAFKVLCDAFDIPCANIIGEANGGGHLWNYVQIDENWYAVDVTWDDQTSIIYNWFLVGADGMTDHTALNNKFAGNSAITFVYPTLNDTAYVYVEKQDYDMSGVSFDDKTVTYDGTTKSLAISGTLPDGVTVDYANNGKIDAGTYQVTASFTGDTVNYNKIPSMTATLTIEPKSIDTVTVEGIENKTYTGSALTQNITVKDGVQILTEGTDYTVSYTDNINVGTATVIIKGIGNYKDEITKTFNIEKAPCSHNWIEATCTTAKTCQLCGEVEGEALGHDWKTATCTEAKTCQRCGVTDGNPLGHSWGAGVIKKAPSCTTDGVMSYTCTTCNVEKTESIPMYGHTWTAADCTSPKTCKTCGVTDGDALGHSWNSGEVTKAATCTADGVKTHTCTTCGETKTETIPMSGHTWTAANCTASRYCQICGLEDGNPLGHSWNSGEVTKDATCTEAGVKIHTCTVCGETKTETVPMIDHSWNDATCTEAKTCKNCGLTDGEALGHKWNLGKTTKEPTCTTAGEKTYTCTTCSETKTEPVAKKDHSFNAATCTKAKTCKNCGTTEGSPLGHSYSSSYTVDKKATTSADGSQSKHCTRSGCSSKSSVTAIPKIASQKLSTTKYVYSGSTKKPTVTVKDSAGNELVNGTDYTLPTSYGKKSVGRYAVTITYKGKYSGTETLYFTIVPKAPASASANLSSASQTSGYDDIKFKWDPSTGASGYNVYYKKSSASSYTFYKAVTGTSVTKKNLSDGVKYTFKVVPYYKDANGTKYSSTKQYKTASVYTLKKISQPTVTKSGTKVKVKWKNISGETGYQISQSTSKTGTKIVATYKTTSGTYKTVSATKGKTYYYKVRAYKVVDGKKIYGPWSEVRKYKR